MTTNEHVDALISEIPYMSKDELRDLESSLYSILCDIRWKLTNQTHSQLHHRCAPDESNK